MDKHGLQRLVLKPEGWSSWKWRNYRVNYTSAGMCKSALAYRVQSPSLGLI